LESIVGLYETTDVESSWWARQADTDIGTIIVEEIVADPSGPIETDSISRCLSW
jgi:hypothetical protein